MPREATGTVKLLPPRKGEKHGHYALGIFVPKERRPLVEHRDRLWFHLPPGTSKERACEAAAALSEQVRTGTVADLHALLARASKPKKEQKKGEAPETVAGVETCDAWYKRFLKSREALISSTDDDRSRWQKWISPTIGAKAITAVDADDIETIRDKINAAVAAYEQHGPGKDRLTGTTPRNIWTCLTTAFKHASTRIGSREFRVREAQGNPCAGIQRPMNGDSRDKHWIRPAEFLALVGCKDVPREWRDLHAVACFLYLRPGELRELLVGDVDLVTEEVHIRRAWNERKKKVELPKSKKGIRHVPIHPNLMPLLKRMIEGRKADERLVPVLAATHENDHAELTREHLKLAAVDRAELFVSTATHKMIGFRSWRETGITWCFLADERVEVVQRRAGHKHIETTLGYAKEVENRKGKFGVPFPPLPSELIGTDDDTTPPDGGSERDDRSERANSAQPETAQLDRHEPVVYASAIPGFAALSHESPAFESRPLR